MKCIIISKPKSNSSKNPSAVKQASAVHDRDRRINTSLQLPGTYPWKVLNAMIFDLAYLLTEDEYELISTICRNKDFFSYQILGETWGLRCKNPMQLTQHISRKRAKYQLSALLKKFCFQTDDAMREANAIQKFLNAEAVCQAYNHGGYKALSAGKTETDAAIFTYAKSFLSKLLGERCLTHKLVTDWSRHGPGSNLDTCKGQANKFFKFANWPYSCTSGALPVARYLIQTDQRWFEALVASYYQRKKIPLCRKIDMGKFWKQVFKVVPGNKVTFVPKNADTLRTIAIEPAMNLMLQLGVDGHIRRRLRRWDVDLNDQSKNQRFAELGSVRSGPFGYVTLDLAAASDSISLSICELLLPSEWYSYLLKLRSPYGILKNEKISYEKISSMGNGYTFALESAIFAALVYAAIKVQTGTCNFKTDLSIFGDDLICRKESVNRVIRALQLAGFSLNTDKSFVEGPVRESCGSDWFDGKQVRPVFLQRSPSILPDLFVDRNRLKRILETRWGIRNSRTVKVIDRWVPRHGRLYGPYSDTEFESYLHRQLPVGNYRNGFWRYTCLNVRLKEIPQEDYHDFLFRKLMHDLRGENLKIERSVFDKRRKPPVNGSRFTVYANHSLTVTKSVPRTSYWCAEYAR